MHFGDKFDSVGESYNGSIDHEPGPTNRVPRGFFGALCPKKPSGDAPVIVFVFLDFVYGAYFNSWLAQEVSVLP